ncbi:hypothetical protein DLD77_08675 [Chitinophaga alhagiae]|uniref:HTH cro/C1-type domain-containing protein n=1 Tax=Chitinophaga alhagiae TaxID=2203219 RepID=A0ABM6WD11_9BACT|nr:helix-turn-helix transcriptional regulator [Chitinophaga alhagiae]AWO01764.1 hypothetical protein DLD77_08675 [Chitinophaga alhagiae]
MIALNMSAFFLSKTQLSRIYIQLSGKYFGFYQFDLAGVFHSSNIAPIAVLIMNIGLQIRKVRESKNVTQEYMAAKLCVSKTSYGNIERNTIKRLTWAMVMAIAEVLEVHYSELLVEQPPQARMERSGKPGCWQAVMNCLQHLHEKMDSMEKQLQRMQ